MRSVDRHRFFFPAFFPSYQWLAVKQWYLKGFFFVSLWFFAKIVIVPATRPRLPKSSQVTRVQLFAGLTDIALVDEIVQRAFLPKQGDAAYSYEHENCSQKAILHFRFSEQNLAINDAE